MNNKTEKIRENRLRGEAAHFGIRMTKSRVALSLDNHGGYMLVNASRNAVVIGGARVRPGAKKNAALLRSAPIDGRAWARAK